MGVAAYNRGSKLVRDQISMERGTYQSPIVPQKRPETWGDKTRAKAEEKAQRLVAPPR